MLFALVYITSSSFPGSEPAAAGQSDCQNKSVLDYPITVPVKILKALVEISDKDEGLLFLWRNSFSLTEEMLLKTEVRIKHVYMCS